MERITKRIGGSIDFVDGKGYAKLSHKESTRLLFEKLAEYEDIGLTPEEIKSFLRYFGITVTMINRELKEQHEEDKKIISKMAGRIKKFEDKYFED